MADWKFDSKSSEGRSGAEAWGIDPDGVVINLNVYAGTGKFAHVGSSDSTQQTPPNYEGAGIGTSHPADFPAGQLVTAKTRLSTLAVAHTAGYGAGGKGSSGAKMVHHYEANKAGRARGTMKLETLHENATPDEFPEDTITVAAGSSQINATFSRASGKWSVYGTLHTATGVQTINQQVDGFGDLDEEFQFDQAISQGSSFTIVGAVNDGSPNDNLKLTGTGTHTESAVELQGYVILDTVIHPDH